MSLFFGNLSQLGYVSRDLHASMKFFHERMGIGPWYYFSAPMKIAYDGHEGMAELSIGFANNGPLQFELIQQTNHTPSMFKAFGDREKFDLHAVQHYSFWTESYDDSLALAVKNGFVELQRTIVERGRVIYLAQPAQPDFVLEFAETTPSRAAMRKVVRDAAMGWDGRDPTRLYKA